MSDADRSPSPAAAAFAFGLAVACASFALEVFLPLFTPPDGDHFTGVEPLIRAVFITGGVLRVPLTVAVFAGLATLFDPEGRRTGLGRFVLVLLAVCLLTIDATSYRWLGARGRLFELGSTLSPLEPIAGRGGLVAGFAALLALALAWGIENALLPVLQRRFERKGIVIADAIAVALLGVFGIAAVGGARGSLSFGVTPPLVALLGRAPAPTPAATAGDDGEVTDEAPAVPADGIPIPPPDVRALVADALGTESPEPVEDGARPFCRHAMEPSGPATTPRSIVLLVVRGLDAEALGGSAPAMPALAALARDEIAFTDLVAGADDPTQGLVQLLSGVGPLAPSRYHEIARTPRLPSLPETLRRLGLASYYVTTNDLSPGRERTLVRQLAFDEVEEPSLSADITSGEAGRTDAATLERVRARLAATRGRPRMVVAPLVSGLSGDVADPTAPDAIAQRRAALGALDGELARFVADFRTNEAPSGAVLAITSDAVDPSVVVGSGGSAASRPSFHVPFILVNLRADERTLGRNRAGMLAGQLDVAQTLLGLEGQGAIGCFQGRDLLSTRTPLPSTRTLPAFGGPDQQYVYVFDRRFRWQIDRTHLEGAFEVYDRTTDRALARNLYDANDPEVEVMRDFVMAYMAMGRYLAINDRFLPGQSEIVAVAAPPAATTTRVQSVDGATVEAIANAIAERRRDRTTAVRLTVTIGEGLAPMLGGEPLGAALTTLARPLQGLELMLDIGMADQPTPRRSVTIARALVGAISAASLSAPPILLPQDPILATSLAARTDYTVYARIPGNALELVDTAHGFGVDGVVFGSDLAARSIIERARLEGMRVAIDGLDVLDALGDTGAGARPDYVIVGSTTPPPAP